MFKRHLHLADYPRGYSGVPSLPLVRPTLCLLALGAVFHSSLALAQSAADKTTARKLAHEGQTALMAGDLDVAAQRFNSARKLVNAPTLHVGYARARAGQGRLVEAYDVYQQVIRVGVPADASAAFHDAVAEATKASEELEKQLAWVTVELTGLEGSDAAIVEVNGSRMPPAAVGIERAVDPGVVVVTVRAEGYAGDRVELQAEEGQHGLVAALKVTKQAHSGATDGAHQGAAVVEDQGADSWWDDWHEPAAWTALGLGGAGLVTGAVATAIAVSEKSALDGQCIYQEGAPAVCPGARESQIASYETAGTVAVAGFIAGGVFATAGLALLLTLPDSNTASTAALPRDGVALTPYVTPTSAGFTGRFVW